MCLKIMRELSLCKFENFGRDLLGSFNRKAPRFARHRTTTVEQHDDSPSCRWPRSNCVEGMTSDNGRFLSNQSLSGVGEPIVICDGEARRNRTVT